MTGPFDVTLKSLLQEFAADWLRIAGIPCDGPIEFVESDLSTVAAEADKVFRLSSPVARLVQLELQSSYDRGLPSRTLLYHVVLTHRERLPVISVIILLRPSADGPEMTGILRRDAGDGATYLEFRYHVVRLWEIPVEQALKLGVGVLPIVPLTSGAAERLADVIHTMDQRFRAEVDEPQAAVLWTMTEVLMGLRYSPELCTEMIRGVQSMRDSHVYQRILNEGRVEGRVEGRAEAIDEAIRALQRVLQGLGEERLGAASAEVQSQIQQIRSIERLQELSLRVLHAGSWQELLSGDQSPP